MQFGDRGVVSLGEFICSFAVFVLNPHLDHWFIIYNGILVLNRDPKVVLYLGNFCHPRMRLVGVRGEVAWHPHRV